MSILVKGWKMPESCLLCFAQFGGWCYVAPPEIDERVAPTVEEAAEQGKPEWCPLIELPDHGDLIDRSKLKDEFIGDAFSGKGGFAVWSGDILSAPVVIPAERSEDGET